MKVHLETLELGLSREGMVGNGKRRGVVMRTIETEKPCGSLLSDKLIRKCKEKDGSTSMGDNV